MKEDLEKKTWEMQQKLRKKNWNTIYSYLTQTQSLNELGRRAYLRGTCVKVRPVHVLNCTMECMCAWAEAHGPLLRPRKLICFRFAPVACIGVACADATGRNGSEWDGMRCGWKAGKGDVCICDCRECCMVLNVADRTGLEPSPGTRTSLQVTSKSGQCCQNDVTHSLLSVYCPPFKVQYLCFVLFHFSFLYFYKFFGHNQGCKYKTKRYWKIKSLCVNHMQPPQYWMSRPEHRLIRPFL